MESDEVLSTSDPLVLISEARAVAADRLVTPWWYHPILGVLLGGYLVAFTLGGTVGRIVAAAVFFAGLVLLMSAYKRKTGVWISGFEAGAASRWAYLMGGLGAATMAASFLIHLATGRSWPTWVLAMIAAVSVVLLGRRFDVALREQLRAGA